MRKIIALFCAFGLIFCLTGCNAGMGIGNMSFNHVHFSDQVEGKCANVIKWYDNETGAEVKTKEYGSMFLSEGTYMLIENADLCPYCN